MYLQFYEKIILLQDTDHRKHTGRKFVIVLQPKRKIIYN